MYIFGGVGVDAAAAFFTGAAGAATAASFAAIIF